MNVRRGAGRALLLTLAPTDGGNKHGWITALCPRASLAAPDLVTWLAWGHSTAPLGARWVTVSPERTPGAESSCPLGSQLCPREDGGTSDPAGHSQEPAGRRSMLSQPRVCPPRDVPLSSTGCAAALGTWPGLSLSLVGAVTATSPVPPGVSCCTSSTLPAASSVAQSSQCSAVLCRDISVSLSPLRAEQPRGRGRGQEHRPYASPALYSEAPPTTLRHWCPGRSLLPSGLARSRCAGRAEAVGGPGPAEGRREPERETQPARGPGSDGSGPP